MGSQHSCLTYCKKGKKIANEELQLEEIDQKFESSSFMSQANSVYSNAQSQNEIVEICNEEQNPNNNLIEGQKVESQELIIDQQDQSPENNQTGITNNQTLKKKLVPSKTQLQKNLSVAQQEEIANLSKSQSYQTKNFADNSEADSEASPNFGNRKSQISQEEKLQTNEFLLEQQRQIEEAMKGKSKFKKKRKKHRKTSQAQEIANVSEIENSEKKVENEEIESDANNLRNSQSKKGCLRKISRYSNVDKDSMNDKSGKSVKFQLKNNKKKKKFQY